MDHINSGILEWLEVGCRERLGISHPLVLLSKIERHYAKHVHHRGPLYEIDRTR